MGLEKKVFDVRIGDIVFHEKYYPRLVTDDATVERYSKCLDELPPVLLNQDGWLIDGKHRVDAHVLAGRDRICAVREYTDSVVSFITLSCRLNVVHGKPLDVQDRMKSVMLLFNEAGGDEERMCDAFEARARVRAMMPGIFGVSEDTITGDLKGTVRNYQQARHIYVEKLLAEGMTHKEIANEVGLTEGGIGNISSSLKKTSLFSDGALKSEVQDKSGMSQLSLVPSDSSVIADVVDSQVVGGLLVEDKRVLDSLRKGDITGKVARGRFVRNAKRRIQKQAQAELDTDSPDDVGEFRDYAVVDIDPPWPVEKIDRDVSMGQTGFEYPVMSVKEIKGLELPCENAHIFLWTTHKYLPDAFECFKAWDVRYVSTMVWRKNGGFQPFNLMQYNCEFVLYGRKGAPMAFLDTKNFFACFDGRRREHSRKPVEFYDTITRVTGGRRCVLFGREFIEGWEVFGNESDKFVEG